MYFPGDPLLPFDPIFNSVPDEKARTRLISLFDWENTIPEHALGYRFDIVLREPRSHSRGAVPMTLTPTSSQTVGPFFHLGVCFLTREHLEARGIAGELVTIRGRVLDGDGKPLPDALSSKFGGKPMPLTDTAC